tara:strand:- start:722 stop:1861 length:1140 start_codon:yes stop_codon:yes gene_type:complete
VINIKRTFFFIIKITLGIAAFLTLILFFYAAFFYETAQRDEGVKKSDELSAIKTEIKQEKKDQKSEKLIAEEKKDSSEGKKLIKENQIETIIKDGMVATVGNKAITKTDVINEIKSILILNNKRYSEKERDQLNQMAIKNLIKRNIKIIEIEKNSFLEFNPRDLAGELNRLAGNINVNLDGLKDICKSNDLDFSIIEDKIKTQLLWNSLIFQIYKNRISINVDEIDEQLKLVQTKREITEYLISEIVIKNVEKSKLKSTIEELKNKIETEGFKNVAINLSIADSSTRGGDLGWINENLISKKLRSVIANTPIGSISEPILLPNGILLFQVRNKKIIEKDINIEELKDQLVRKEKTKILNMYSLSHYNNVKGSISVNFLQ